MELEEEKVNLFEFQAMFQYDTFEGVPGYT